MVSVRPYLAADFHAVRTWFPDPASAIQWAGPDIRIPLEMADFDRMLEETRGQAAARWMLTGVSHEDVSAHAQVVLDWKNGVARLARVAVNPAFRGKGLALPFLRQVVSRVFEPAAFERLELNVYTFNVAAIATYRRLGFVEEGVRRSSVKVGEERWDTAIYGMLREEYRALDFAKGAVAP